MTQLIIPRKMKQRRLADAGGDMQESGGFVTKAGMAAIAAAYGDSDAPCVQDLDTPIPEGLPKPQQWRVTLMPVCQPTKQGSILLPQSEIDLQNWTHQLWKVCAVGPLVYRGPAWAGFAEEELAPMRPKVGDLYLADPKQPRRYKYKGILFIVVNDDQLWSRVQPDEISGLSFSGINL